MKIVSLEEDKLKQKVTHELECSQDKKKLELIKQELSKTKKCLQESNQELSKQKTLVQKLQERIDESEKESIPEKQESAIGKR